MSVSPGHLYILHFEYLGLPGPGSILGNLGGVIGFSEDTPGSHRWLAGTVLCCYIDDDLLIDDGTWHSYSLTIDPYLPGSVYDGLPSNNTIRVMIEDFLHAGGIPGDAYFDNVSVTVAPGPPTVVRFCEDFEGGLSDWVGKNEGVHHGLIVADPVRAGNQVLTFTALNEAGDIFGPELGVRPDTLYTIRFEYLGVPGPDGTPDNLGGVIGFSEDTPGTHRWLAGTVLCCYIDDDPLIDDGTWHSYSLTIDPFAPGPVYDGTPSDGTIRVMIEDFIHSGGIAGDVFFDNVCVTLYGLNAGGAGDPTIIDGEAFVDVCVCNCHGDPQCDAITDVLDVVKAVGVAFRGGSDIGDPNPYCPWSTTDSDCDGDTDVIDIVRVVNVAFRNQDPAANFCRPCGP